MRHKPIAASIQPTCLLVPTCRLRALKRHTAPPSPYRGEALGYSPLTYRPLTTSLKLPPNKWGSEGLDNSGIYVVCLGQLRATPTQGATQMTYKMIANALADMVQSAAYHAGYVVDDSPGLMVAVDTTRSSMCFTVITDAYMIRTTDAQQAMQAIRGVVGAC